MTQLKGGDQYVDSLFELVILLGCGTIHLLCDPRNKWWLGHLSRRVLVLLIDDILELVVAHWGDPFTIYNSMQ